MNYNELTKKMKAIGWEFERTADGSHMAWYHQVLKKRIIIPRHGSKELKGSLLEGLLKQAGLKK